MGSTREQHTGPPSDSDLGTEAQESKSAHKAAQSHWSRGWDEIRTPFLFRHLGRHVSTTSLSTICLWSVRPARRPSQSILREINPEYSLEGLMLKLELQYFGHF